MDQSSPPDETAAHILPGPAHTADSADDFTPLRLVLQPTGAVLEVKRPDVIVGRHSGADVRLSLPDISRRHCRLFQVEGRWQVHDLDSLNGVWLNDEAIKQAVLNHGDTIRIGGFTFKIDLAKPATAADGALDGVLRSIFSALPPPEDSPQSRRRAS